MKDKILVVGGAGYIGGAVTDILLEKKKEFIVYDNLLYERDYRKPAKFIYGDIRDRKKLKELIKSYKPTSIIWLAAIVGDGACQVNPDLTVEVNQKSVEWLAKNYNGRIIFTSTCSVYGKNDKELNEEDEKNPLSLYALTKLKAENALKDKNAVIFRLGTLHGVSDSFSRIRLDLVVNILSLKAAHGEPLTVFGGDQWRPLLHVKDAAKAIVKASLITKKQNISPGIYNLAQKNMRIKEVAEAIAKNPLLKKRVKIKYTELSFEDARNYRVSTKKYDSQPGAVKFKRTVLDGSKEIVQLILENRIKDPLNPNYHNAKYVKKVIYNDQKYG